MALAPCRECGREISTQAAACPHCGAPVRIAQAHVETRTGSAGNVLAGIASFIVPGLGQLLQGRVLAGIFHFFLAGFLWFLLLGWIVHLASAFGAAMWAPKQ